MNDEKANIQNLLSTPILIFNLLAILGLLTIIIASIVYGIDYITNSPNNFTFELTNSLAVFKVVFFTLLNFYTARTLKKQSSTGWYSSMAILAILAMTGVYSLINFNIYALFLLLLAAKGIHYFNQPKIKHALLKKTPSPKTTANNN